MNKYLKEFKRNLRYCGCQDAFFEHLELAKNDAKHYFLKTSPKDWAVLAFEWETARLYPWNSNEQSVRAWTTVNDRWLIQHDKLKNEEQQIS